MKNFYNLDANKFDRGLKKFQKDLDNLSIAMERETISLVMQCGFKIAKEAADRIRVLKHWITGNLFRSQKAVLKEVTSSAIYTEVGSDADYALYVEKLPDGGYLYVSMLKLRTEIEKFYNVGLKKILEEFKA